MSSPLVSILIIAYNQQDFVEQSVEKVRASFEVKKGDDFNAWTDQPNDERNQCRSPKREDYDGGRSANNFVHSGKLREGVK